MMPANTFLEDLTLLMLSLCQFSDAKRVFLIFHTRASRTGKEIGKNAC